MKNLILILFTFFLIFSLGCGKEDSYSDGGLVSMSSSEKGDRSTSSPPPGSGQGSGGTSGVITAGEWNDLKDWGFWQNIISDPSYSGTPATWGFYHNHRISVVVIDNNSQPVPGVKLELRKFGNPVWEAVSDNEGKAELWIDLFQNTTTVNINDYGINVNNGQLVVQNLKTFDQGLNTITLNAPLPVNNSVEIAFVVDATGSMGDELTYLKDELKDVINRAKNNNPGSQFFVSAVFYRDEGDEYVTRVSDFTNNVTQVLQFINDQSASGGGDFPEAVHSALKASVVDLQWSNSGKTKILFLLLDAPPHKDQLVTAKVRDYIKTAAARGIRVVPISASGIDKETEFLLRFFAISTNGTYVFITDHSGIGNDHLEPTVGNYQVEYLNDLMVRLITEYSK